jgi:hypothetical protein
MISCEHSDVSWVIIVFSTELRIAVYFCLLQSGTGYLESKAAHVEGGLGAVQSATKVFSPENVEQDCKVYFKTQHFTSFQVCLVIQSRIIIIQSYVCIIDKSLHVQKGKTQNIGQN